ncbi:hypothetical protein J0X19_06865 [Hymenobacter sp. BT186]|uniref:Uncharacterized protein n=1 Tax=Hymenobacter telluris TaxID=2816474 RepID=A0A939EUV3_9BACT|nr:hypothetical protein [Hymenobacter telluris]MBO0357661.1 hypothetical protein [Hymenobacter telluris]MBW3373688.1 hypothetical protein [Hymenobacter norwichensis]
MPQPSIYYVLLAGCALLALGLMLAVWRRPNTQRRGFRTLASVLAATGLWLTAYPPERAVSILQAEAILLTSHYQPDTLRALLARFGAHTQVWRYALTTDAETPNDTPAVASLTTLREQMPALRRLHVLGQGVPAAALPALDSVRLVHHAPPRFVGFRAAHWNRQLELGKPLVVEGYFAASVTGPVWVRLQVAGAPRDSVQLPNGQGRFQLRYVPRAVGRLVATVSARQSGRGLATEPVPTEVLPTRPLRVLLLAATPSFELKFLKNHLAARQHAVAWRVGISRNLTQTEFSNQSATDLSRLTPALLARYDVLIAEAGVLAALPSAEAQALRLAQRTGSLGLVVLADVAGLPAIVPNRTSLRLVAQTGAAATRPQRLSWPEAPAATALAPTTLALQPGTARPLVTLAGGGQVVVASQRSGAGGVVVSTLLETYPWLLQNAAATYGSYWSHLLTAVAPPSASAASWLITTPWPRPQLPVILRRTGTFPSTPAVLATAAGSARLPLQQDTELPEWSTATYWPGAAGWQQVQVAGQPAQWLYVFGEQEWLGPETQRWEQAAQPWLAGATQPLPALARKEPWPAAWFFALFVLAAGFLWLEEKL